MEYCPLLQGRPDGPMEPVLEEQLPFPQHHVREQVPVESRVLREQRVEIQLPPSGHQLVEPDLPWGDRGPAARSAAMVRVGPFVADTLKDHTFSLPISPPPLGFR